LTTNPNPNKNVKQAMPYWHRDTKLYQVADRQKCLRFQYTPVDIKITDPNRRIEDICWEYHIDSSTPDPKSKSVFISQKMPVIDSNGDISLTDWKVNFYNNGPDDVYIDVYAKVYQKVGKIDVDSYYKCFIPSDKEDGVID